MNNINSRDCTCEGIFIPAPAPCDSCDELAQEFEQARQEAVTAAGDAQDFARAAEQASNSAQSSERIASSSANYARVYAENSQNASSQAEHYKDLAEDAAEASASVYTIQGNVTFSVLESGQVRETWIKEE